MAREGAERAEPRSRPRHPPALTPSLSREGEGGERHGFPAPRERRGEGSEATDAELLLELLSEEIPARMQARAAEDLKRLVCERLDKAQLTFSAPSIRHAAPSGAGRRRVAGEAARHARERKGRASARPRRRSRASSKPPARLADEAEVRETDKGSFYFAHPDEPGRRPLRSSPTSSAKSMRLPLAEVDALGLQPVPWVRPLQGMLALFDGTPFPSTLNLAN